MSNSNPKEVKPVYWKNVFITIVTVYPLILLSEVILDLFLPMDKLNPKLSIFLSVVIVAALMAWPVMPIANKYLGGWMRR